MCARLHLITDTRKSAAFRGRTTTTTPRQNRGNNDFIICFLAWVVFRFKPNPSCMLLCVCVCVFAAPPLLNNENNVLKIAKN